MCKTKTNFENSVYVPPENTATAKADQAKKIRISLQSGVHQLRSKTPYQYFLLVKVNIY